MQVGSCVGLARAFVGDAPPIVCALARPSRVALFPVAATAALAGGAFRDGGDEGAAAPRAPPPEGIRTGKRATLAAAVSRRFLLKSGDDADDDDAATAALGRAAAADAALRGKALAALLPSTLRAALAEGSLALAGDAASGAIDLGDGAYYEDPSALGADVRMLEVGDAGAARLDRAFATVALHRRLAERRSAAPVESLARPSLASAEAAAGDGRFLAAEEAAPTAPAPAAGADLV